MRIVHVCRVGWPSIGGVERMVDGLTRHQVAQGHEVTVVTGRRLAGRRVEHAMRHGVRYHRVHAVGRGAYSIPWGLDRLLERADVVHAHGQVSREAARAATQAADIQLVILNADPRETTAIPAKAYEMLPSPQPTLCIGPEGNPTREVLGRKSVSHYGQDAKGIAEWLASRFQASGWPPAADVSDLTHAAVIERLSEHLHDVLMEGPNP